jgi:ElaB/YqjD/DUF883 family membrane-anchored ribosome-binding protein
MQEEEDQDMDQSSKFVERGDDGNRIEDVARDVEEKLRQADSRFRMVCREHPLMVLAGAVAAGFVVGRLASRR